MSLYVMRKKLVNGAWTYVREEWGGPLPGENVTKPPLAVPKYSEQWKDEPSEGYNAKVAHLLALEEQHKAAQRPVDAQAKGAATERLLAKGPYSRKIDE